MVLRFQITVMRFWLLIQAVWSDRSVSHANLVSVLIGGIPYKFLEQKNSDQNLAIKRQNYLPSILSLGRDNDEME